MTRSAETHFYSLLKSEHRCSFLATHRRRWRCGTFPSAQWRWWPTFSDTRHPPDLFSIFFYPVRVRVSIRNESNPCSFFYFFSMLYPILDLHTGNLGSDTIVRNAVPLLNVDQGVSFLLRWKNCYVPCPRSSYGP